MQPAGPSGPSWPAASPDPSEPSAEGLLEPLPLPPGAAGGRAGAADDGSGRQQQQQQLLAAAAGDAGPSQPAKRPPPEQRRRCMSDKFMMFTYKIKLCKRPDPHNWRLCPYAHPGEAGKRRPPHSYQAVMCDFSKTRKECSHGEGCLLARNALEYWLHPDKYRTILCGHGEACNRNICFFAHNQSELRAPTSRAGSGGELPAPPYPPADQVRDAFSQLGISGQQEQQQQQQQQAPPMLYVQPGGAHGGRMGMPAVMGGGGHPGQQQVFMQLQRGGEPQAAHGLVVGGMLSVPAHGMMGGGASQQYGGQQLAQGPHVLPRYDLPPHVQLQHQQPDAEQGSPSQPVVGPPPGAGWGDAQPSGGMAPHSAGGVAGHMPPYYALPLASISSSGHPVMLAMPPGMMQQQHQQHGSYWQHQQQMMALGGSGGGGGGAPGYGGAGQQVLGPPLSQHTEHGQLPGQGVRIVQLPQGTGAQAEPAPGFAPPMLPPGVEEW